MVWKNQSSNLPQSRDLEGGPLFSGYSHHCGHEAPSLAADKSLSSRDFEDGVRAGTHILKASRTETVRQVSVPIKIAVNLYLPVKLFRFVERSPCLW